MFRERQPVPAKIHVRDMVRVVGEFVPESAVDGHLFGSICFLFPEGPDIYCQISIGQEAAAVFWKHAPEARDLPAGPEHIKYLVSFNPKAPGLPVQAAIDACQRSDSNITFCSCARSRRAASRRIAAQARLAGAWFAHGALMWAEQSVELTEAMGLDI